MSTSAKLSIVALELKPFEITVENPHIFQGALGVLHVDLVSDALPLLDHLIDSIRANTTLYRKLLWEAKQMAIAHLETSSWMLNDGVAVYLYAVKDTVPAHFSFDLKKRSY